ncbi:LysR family transcriptional regulator [Vibrio paucivorans]
MAKDLFSRLDLNLLRTFIVLHQECNMRKASERLLVSQPAISQSLQKLRNHFDDELFVKVRTGLEPTAYADKLADLITPHLNGLEEALNNSIDFNPSAINQTIKVALTSAVMVCLSGPLFAKIKKLAPKANIEMVSWSHNTVEDIQKGKILMGLNYNFDYPKDLYRNKVLDLTGLAVVRKDHPLDVKIAVLKDFEPYELASIVIPGYNDDRSFAADMMRKYGLDGKVGFRSELMLAIMDVVQHTDMIMPHSNLFPIHRYPEFRGIEIKIDGKPYNYPVFNYFHMRNRNSQLLHWLQSQVEEVLQDQVAIHNNYRLSLK